MVGLPSSTAVLIVGGGPCGLTLAIELARRGVRSALVDKRPGTAFNPQANATQARTMEHFRRLGFADEIRAAGLPADYPTDVAYFTRYTGYELARYRAPSSGQASDVAKNAASAWPSPELPHRVSQKFVEQVLQRHAAREELASLNYDWRLDGFHQNGDAVTAEIENVATGQHQRVRAQYLVGVDGARSTVRSLLGIRYRGETGVQRDFMGGKMVAVHLKAPSFYQIMPHERAWMYWAFNSQRRSVLAAVNGEDEFVFHTQLKPGESEQVSDARARELFIQVMGVPLDVEVLSAYTWLAGYTLVAERFCDGRVFIGGDAAHLFTPTGGLGYNTAVEDAVNLGWKLAATINGTAGPALLASYEQERQPMAIRNTAYARGFADSIGHFAPHPAIEDAGALGDAERAAAGEYLNAHSQREFRVPGITFGGRYDDSPIITPDGTSPPLDTANRYEQSAVPGGRAPHMWLADGRSIYDLFGFDWTLLRQVDSGIDPDQSETLQITNAARDIGVALTIIDIADAGARLLYGADAVLIRPDLIVAWRGSARAILIADALRRGLDFGRSEVTTFAVVR